MLPAVGSAHAGGVLCTPSHCTTAQPQHHPTPNTNTNTRTRTNTKTKTTIDHGRRRRISQGSQSHPRAEAGRHGPGAAASQPTDYGHHDGVHDCSLL